jgi:hypothetical protein
MKTKKAAKKAASPIRIQYLKELDDADLVATFMLVFHGLAIDHCGAFYTRKGELTFQLPYRADFSLSEIAHAEISEKLSAALKDSKTKKPPESDSDCPF